MLKQSRTIGAKAAVLLLFTALLASFAAAVELPIGVKWSVPGAILTVEDKTGAVDDVGNASICCFPFGGAAGEVEYYYRIEKEGYRAKEGYTSFVTQNPIVMNGSLIKECEYTENRNYSNDPGPYPADADNDGINVDCDCDDEDASARQLKKEGPCPVKEPETPPEPGAEDEPEEEPEEELGPALPPLNLPMVCGDKYCDSEGETRENCCEDCGCPEENDFCEKEACTTSPANREACKDFEESPEDFDLYYDNRMILSHLSGAVKNYEQQGNEVKIASTAYSGFDIAFIASLSKHLFTPNSRAQYTGRELSLPGLIESAYNERRRPLRPGEVLELCLQAADGYMFDALLTCHNFLREDGYRSRNIASIRANINAFLDRLKVSKSENQMTQLLELIQQKEDEIRKISTHYGYLQNIRHSDNVGAWYHLFGVMAYSLAGRENYATSFFESGLARSAVFGEHRVYKPYWEDQEIDAGEYCWDVWGARLGIKMHSLAGGMSRFERDAREHRNSLESSIVRGLQSMILGFRGGNLK